VGPDPATVPGHAWLEILHRPSLEAFASAFTTRAVLEAAVLSAPIVGPISIRGFFDATRSMYDRIAFVHETRSACRTQLEWEGGFADREIAGTTIVAHDADGAIESIRLYHRPYEQVIAFSAELARRLRPGPPDRSARTGPPRLPPIRPTDLDSVQRALYGDMRSGIATGFNAFRTALDDGTLIGPWNASLHHPAVGKASLELTQAVNALGALPANVKEVVILVVGGFHRAAYEIYAHVAVAERLGMPLARVSSLVSNVKPADLSPDEAVAFDVGYSLCRGGFLPDPTWHRAVAAFGELGAAEIIYLVGVYAFVSTVLNGFDVPAPEIEAKGNEMQQKPSVVLVHGAWADGSSWSKVIRLLQAKGFKVTAVQIPLTSLDDDIAVTRSVLAAQKAPTVLVAHSYGGIVISGAANGAPDVTALVYIAAFCLDEGESIETLSKQGPAPAGAAQVRPDDNGFLWIDRTGFAQAFAADVDPAEANVMAATQKPLSIKSFVAKSGPPAWKRLPSFYLVSTNDQMIPPRGEEIMAARMGATVRSVAASHASMVSHPQEVADIILLAAESGQANAARPAPAPSSP
jgi:pimeloyl-ACP methyl ester carboxylesterase